MIKLSIIVPIYGVDQYLRKCVDSLLAQDLPLSEYEIILVDDGSPDACPQICDDYATAHKNIKVIHRENGGLSAARNSGIEVARGEYLMFVDSDDYIEPNVLKGLMEQVEWDKLDVLRYRMQYVNPQYEVYNPYKIDPFKGNDYSEVPTDGVSFLNSRMNTQCYAWQFILRRDLIFNSLTHSFINSFTPGIYFEDTDWTPRMLCKAKRVASTATIVYNYLMREGSITNAVNRSKQKKVLDDKMRLIKALQMQANDLQGQGKDNRWFARMIADNVISIIGIIAKDFYRERKSYLAQLKLYGIYPIQSKSMKARLINVSPSLTVNLLHIKYSVRSMKKLIRKILAYLRGEPQNIEMLYKRGLRVGKNFYRGPGVIIDPMHCYHITIGDNVSLAPRVHILAHDASTAMFLGKTRAANVTIGNEVFVGAGSIILPGVHIGNRVIIGAGSIVSKDIPDNSVAVGNPAKVVCPIDEYLEKEKAKMRQENTFKGLWWEHPDEIAQAIAAAEKYGEIFVN